MNNQKENLTVTTFYKFVDIDDLQELKISLLKFCELNYATGTILLAPEGINGTICALDKFTNNIINFIKSDKRFSNISTKKSYSNFKAFKRMKVKVKKEIVAFGDNKIKPSLKTGKFISSEIWNSIISDKETIIIDTRNSYEHSIGTFEGAIQPNSKSFKEFSSWVESNLSLLENKKIAMFCTGGIRCEKASSYLLEKGFKNVFQLEGGILKYIEKIKPEDSMWKGECFVFDDRVSLKQDLSKGEHYMCFACRMPIKSEDKKNSKYVEGVSCHHCYDFHSLDRKLRFKERQKQIFLKQSKSKVS